MTRINTNVASLVAQNRLARSNRDLQTTLERLSTGLRINDGSDDPAGLIASEALRSEVSSISKAISNTKRATQIISTADGALAEVSNLLNDIRGLVTEAANTGGLSNDEIFANQLQIDSSLEAINRIAQTTTFQGRKLLDGSLDFLTNAGNVDSIVDVDIDQALLNPVGQLNVEVVINQAAEKATAAIGNAPLTARAAATATFGTGADNITLTATAGNQGYRLNDVTVQFVDDPANAAGPTAVYDDDQKVLTVNFDSTAPHDYDDIVTAIAGSVDAAGNATGLFAAATVTGTTGTNTFTTPLDPVTTGKTGGETLPADLTFQLNGSPGSETFSFSAGTSIGQLVKAINLVSDATQVDATFDAVEGLVLQSQGYGREALVELDIISEGSGGGLRDRLSVIGANHTGTDIDAAVNGIPADGRANWIQINTSQLDLRVQVEPGSDVNFSFDISGGGALFQMGPDVVTNQQARLGIDSVSTGKLGGSHGRLYQLGSGQEFSLIEDITSAAKVIDQAINKITTLRGRLGAFEATTLRSNLESLNETLGNLQEAESSIRDADFAVESANLTRSQILVQSGTNVLSLANQAPQNVLALLQ